MDLKGPQKDNQTLFNGRIWRNKYYRVKGDQFLFKNNYLTASVSINGTTFINVDLLYDIYADEIITHRPDGNFLQINKEMVDSFSLVFENVTRYFFKTDVDSIKGFNGYLNILYRGKCSLFTKYKKEIGLLAVERKYDEFRQVHKIFFEKDGVVNPVAGKRDLMALLGDHKEAVRNFIKKNKLIVKIKQPESLVPVIRFYDSLLIK